jgi:hypothetical protein
MTITVTLQVSRDGIHFTPRAFPTPYARYGAAEERAKLDAWTQGYVILPNSATYEKIFA